MNLFLVLCISLVNPAYPAYGSGGSWLPSWSRSSLLVSAPLFQSATRGASVFSLSTVALAWAKRESSYSTSDSERSEDSDGQDEDKP
jgi:hypothetical protein